MLLSTHFAQQFFEEDSVRQYIDSNSKITDVLCTTALND